MKRFYGEVLGDFEPRLFMVRRVHPPEKVVPMFVYLYDGRVIEVARVTSVKVEQKALVLYAGQNVAGRFSLDEVYFSSKVKSAPSPA